MLSYLTTTSFREKFKYQQQRILFRLLSLFLKVCHAVEEGTEADGVFVQESTPPTAVDDNVSNSFEQKTFMVGSQFILKQLIAQSADVGKDEHYAFLAALSGESGFEGIYGQMFEPHCHSFFATKGGQVRMRRLTMQGADAEQTLFLPQPGETFRFGGHDPKNLQHLEGAWCSADSYLRPFSTTFPTYDSIFIVQETILRPGAKRGALIALNLQMTVSGATGLPPRPKHTLRRDVRCRINQVCKQKWSQEGATFSESVTVFAVPEVCFNSFEFQKEYIMDGETYSKLQPKEQYVLAIPEKAFQIDKDMVNAKKRRLHIDDDEEMDYGNPEASGGPN